MSQHTDETLTRYLAQQPGMEQALLSDPVQHAQTELMRRLLDQAERAMAAEDVPAPARTRVINRIVWGEPTGTTDMHARARHLATAPTGRIPQEFSDPATGL